MLKIDSVIRAFLDARVGKKIKIIIRNGYQITGRLDAWDSQSLLLSVCETDHLILMDNVSSIIPMED